MLNISNSINTYLHQTIFWWQYCLFYSLFFLRSSLIFLINLQQLHTSIATFILSSRFETIVHLNIELNNFPDFLCKTLVTSIRTLLPLSLKSWLCSGPPSNVYIFLLLLTKVLSFLSNVR